MVKELYSVSAFNEKEQDTGSVSCLKILDMHSKKHCEAACLIRYLERRRPIFNFTFVEKLKKNGKNRHDMT